MGEIAAKSYSTGAGGGASVDSGTGSVVELSGAIDSGADLASVTGEDCAVDTGSVSDVESVSDPTPLEHPAKARIATTTIDERLAAVTRSRYLPQR
jgi:hypothetical protein